MSSVLTNGLGEVAFTCVILREIMHLEVVRWAGFPLAGPELLLDLPAPLGAGWGVASPPEGVGLRAR